MPSELLGHNFMFSKLDRTDGTVRFCDEREPARNGQMILAALAPFAAGGIDIGSARRADREGLGPSPPGRAGWRSGGAPAGLTLRLEPGESLFRSIHLNIPTARFT